MWTTNGHNTDCFFFFFLSFLLISKMNKPTRTWVHLPVQNKDTVLIFLKLESAKSSTAVHGSQGAFQQEHGRYAVAALPALNICIGKGCWGVC